MSSVSGNSLLAHYYQQALNSSANLESARQHHINASIQFQTAKSGFEATKSFYNPYLQRAEEFLSRGGKIPSNQDFQIQKMKSEIQALESVSDQHLINLNQHSENLDIARSIHAQNQVRFSVTNSIISNNSTSRLQAVVVPGNSQFPPDLKALYLEYLKDLDNNDNGNYKSRFPGGDKPEEVVEYQTKVSYEQYSSAILFIHDGKNIVAEARFSPDEDEEDGSFLQFDLSVHKNYRQNNLGKALTDSSCLYAETVGCPEVRQAVSLDNQSHNERLQKRPSWEFLYSDKISNVYKKSLS